MKTLLYTGLLAPILPILFFLIFKRKSKERAVWVIFFYATYCALHEVINLYLQQIDSKYVLVLFSLFTIIEFSFICNYFILLYKNQPKKKNVITVIWILFTFYAIISFFRSNKLGSWDSFAIGIESLILIIFSCYHLFTKLRHTDNLSLYSNFHFWTVITFLLYFSGTFFMNIMAETMRRNPDYQVLYYIINSGFAILKYVLLAVAMTMKVKKPKDQLSDLDDNLFLKNSL